LTVFTAECYRDTASLTTAMTDATDRNPPERLEGRSVSVAKRSAREAFIAEAEISAAKVDAGGPLYSSKDVHAYIAARAAGTPACAPEPMRRDPGI
jgi:hypothetical protein